MTLTMPMRDARLTSGHPAVVVKVKIVSLTLPRGAKTHRGMTMAKRPAR